MLRPAELRRLGVGKEPVLWSGASDPANASRVMQRQRTRRRVRIAIGVVIALSITFGAPLVNPHHRYWSSVGFTAFIIGWIGGMFTLLAWMFQRKGRWAGDPPIADAIFAITATRCLRLNRSSGIITEFSLMPSGRLYAELYRLCAKTGAGHVIISNAQGSSIQRFGFHFLADPDAVLAIVEERIAATNVK